MSELWDALIDLDRALPAWWRYLASAGGAVILYRILPRVWRWLHDRQKPFRCGPIVWKRNEEGDVFAGVHFVKNDYPFWANGKWVVDDTPDPATQVDENEDCEEDQRDAD